MITDDDLLLYHYRELDAAERARIGAALAAQPELARRLHTLVAKLDAAAAMPEVPVPEATLQRWQAALEQAAAQSTTAPAARRGVSPTRWQFAAAAAFVIALFVGVLQVTQKPEPRVEETIAAATPAGAETSAYEQGLRVHLASTEKRLAAVGDVTPEERARLVATIIEQNRLYALAAERAGEPQLARVLRAFNPILENVAAGRGETAAADVAQLSFELRVMQARLNPGAGPSNSL